MDEDVGPDEGSRSPSKITWLITQLGDTCKLSVEHEHYAGEIVLVKNTQSGWPIILSGLKTLLETGEPLQIEWSKAAVAVN
ncbi:MAG: hypothetical protein ACXWMY_09695 [Vulcanimicrobiaceae bacterium]